MFLKGKEKFERLLLEAELLSGVPVADILSSSRKQEIVCWRQLISLVLRRAGMPLNKIAELFGQHRTSILSSCEAMARHERKSAAVADIIKNFSNIIK